MEIVVGDLLTVEGEKYLTLDVLEHETKKYAFVNKVLNEEDITEDYCIFEIVDGGVIIVIDEDLKNTLIPKFEESLQKKIKEL